MVGGNYPESLKGLRLWERGKKRDGTIIIITRNKIANRNFTEAILMIPKLIVKEKIKSIFSILN